MSFVVCKQIVKVYRVGKHELVALRGIDFEMEQGEMVAIIGPSGAGKSSLLNLLGGLDTPTAGQLIVGDGNVLELRGKKLADYRLRRVGFVWQQVERNLLTYRSALHNVTLPMLLAGHPAKERHKRAVELLTQVGLSDQMHKLPLQLSGGQQQRVAIAVALANQPDLLLADEPTGALDQQTAKQVMQLLNELRREYGLTILMVTHDMKMAAYADRVLTLRDGALGEVDELRPTFDEDGRILLPEAVNTRLKAIPTLTAEIRPEGVLLRADSHDDENHPIEMDEAPPERQHWWRRKKAGS